jgi:hypothetical protein
MLGDSGSGNGYSIVRRMVVVVSVLAEYLGQRNCRIGGWS